MRIRHLVLGLALACAPLPLLADPIDDAVRGYQERTGTPGVAIAIVKEGVLVRAQGYGYANLEHQVPVHPDTVFQSGSIGKMFTAVAVMLMVEDGKLDLDESIRTYLPDAPAAWAPITARHLLTHTSGINGNPGFDLRKDYTEDELLKIFYQAKLEFPVGERWDYSNTAYALAGILVNKVGGKPYHQVLKERVFAPLGMRTAGLIDDRGIVPNRAAGYENERDGTLVNQQWVAPTGNSTGDGALYLTVLDYVKWEAGVRARKILKPESWRQVFTPVRLTSGKTYPYGFGWALDNFAGHPSQGHGGSWQGFTTHYQHYLERDTAVIALTNLSGGNPSEVVRTVAGLYDPALAPPAGKPIEDRQPEVARRVRALLSSPTLPADEQARFVVQEYLSRVADGYAKARKPLGALKELRLFQHETKGDDQGYVYRGRFEHGIADLGLLLTPDGRILSVRLQRAAAWDAPLN